MDAKDRDSLMLNPSSELIRKKLEAELRATEELARIRQNVIEKRLALELASLNNAEEESEKPSIAPVERKRLCRKPAYYFEDDEEILEAECKSYANEMDMDLRSVSEIKKKLEKLREMELSKEVEKIRKAAIRERETKVRELLEFSSIKTNRYATILRQLFQCMTLCFSRRRSYRILESNEEEPAIITHTHRSSEILAGHVRKAPMREQIKKLTCKRLPEIIDRLTLRKLRFR